MFRPTDRSNTSYTGLVLVDSFRLSKESSSENKMNWPKNERSLKFAALYHSLRSYHRTLWSKNVFIFY